MELTRLTARNGSAAVLTYSVPVEATPSQFGANVDACDTRACGTDVNGGGCGGAGPIPPPLPPPQLASVARTARRGMTRCARMAHSLA